ncbi:hypothetical protein Tco_0415145, partial [Tanacetum coccineum]
QTASASTYENGKIGIIATNDGRVKTVTEASIRRHLKLEDFDGISTLPNTKIFEQVALMGCEALVTDLRQTKKVYGDAFTRLIKKVKKLEVKFSTSSTGAVFNWPPLYSRVCGTSTASI